MPTVPAPKPPFAVVGDATVSRSAITPVKLSDGTAVPALRPTAIQSPAKTLGVPIGR